MKKKICLLMAMLMVALCFCACGNSPKSTITDMCSAMKDYNLRKVGMAFGKEDWTDATVFGNTETGDVLEKRLKQNAKKLEYTIVSVDKDGDTAKVVVDYTYSDCSAVIAKATADYAAQTVSSFISSFLGGNEGTESNSVLFKECVDKAFDEVETKTDTETIVFHLTKTDKNEWIITECSNEFYDVLTCNMRGALVGFSID